MEVEVGKKASARFSTQSLHFLPPRAPLWHIQILWPTSPTSPQPPLHAYRLGLRVCLSPHVSHTSGTLGLRYHRVRSTSLGVALAGATVYVIDPSFPIHLTTLPIPVPFTYRSLILFHLCRSLPSVTALSTPSLSHSSDSSTPLLHQLICEFIAPGANVPFTHANLTASGPSLACLSLITSTTSLNCAVLALPVCPAFRTAAISAWESDKTRTFRSPGASFNTPLTPTILSFSIALADYFQVFLIVLALTWTYLYDHWIFKQLNTCFPEVRQIPVPIPVLVRWITVKYVLY